MAQEVFLRTAAGIISADKFNDNISPFKPTRHGATAVFIREEQYVSPQTTPALGSTVRWDVNKDGDYLDKIWLVVSIAALAKNAGASFARFCDWLGYALIREFRAIYGPIILQRIRKEALFTWAQRFLSDEEYVHNARMVAGGLDNASRIAMASQPQYLKVPIHLLWINNSPTQSLCLQGLGNKPSFEIDFEPSVNLVQQDNTGSLQSPTTEPAFFASSPLGYDCRLGVEYVHVTTSERDAVVACVALIFQSLLYLFFEYRMYRQRKGLRYLIIDVQNAPDQVVDSTQTISGGILSYQVLNINQPVFAGFWLLRWQNDLTANYTSAQTNAVYGRNWFNCNGWLQPAGTSLPLKPMFVGLQMKSGNNNLLYQASIYDFLDDKSIRYFKNGASTLRGIPGFSYAHVPTAPNTCSGMVDFSVVNQPMVFWQFNSSAVTTPLTTVALWAAQDIGFSSNLVISNVMYTYNNVDVTNYDVIRASLNTLFFTNNVIRSVQLSDDVSCYGFGPGNKIFCRAVSFGVVAMHATRHTILKDVSFVVVISINASAFQPAVEAVKLYENLEVFKAQREFELPPPRALAVFDILAVARRPIPCCFFETLRLPLRVFHAFSVSHALISIVGEPLGLFHKNDNILKHLSIQLKMPREVASLTLLAFCALRTAAPRQWRSALIRVGLREDWQEQYIGTQTRQSADDKISLAPKRKILRHAPQMFRCAAGPHWTPYEEDVQGELHTMYCNGKGTRAIRLNGPEYRYCKKHMQTHAREAHFECVYMSFKACEHEYVGYQVNDLANTIVHNWEFKEPRNGIKNSHGFDVIKHNRLAVALSLHSGLFLHYQRWHEEEVKAV